MVIIIGKIFVFIKRTINYFIKKYTLSRINKVGKNVYIGDDVYINAKNIIIGSDVYIGRNSIIQSTHGDVYIGNHVMFGPGVSLHGGNHTYNKIGFTLKDSDDDSKIDAPIIIENDVWIGANSIILKGVKIGEGSIIGAGSIVSKDIPKYTVSVGSPCKPIKKRFKEKDLEKHKRIMIDKGIYEE